MTGNIRPVDNPTTARAGRASEIEVLAVSAERQHELISLRAALGILLTMLSGGFATSWGIGGT